MNVGNPVVAADDDNDVRLYTLGGTDAGPMADPNFEIDRRSGQIKVLKDLNFEVQTDVADDTLTDVEANDNKYRVTVTATGPVPRRDDGPRRDHGHGRERGADICRH